MYKSELTELKPIMSVASIARALGLPRNDGILAVLRACKCPLIRTGRTYKVLKTNLELYAKDLLVTLVLAIRANIHRTTSSARSAPSAPSLRDFA